MKKTLLSADIIDGVCYRPKNLPLLEETVDDQAFYSALDDLEEGDFLLGLVSDKMLKKIIDEYGISR